MIKSIFKNRNSLLFVLCILSFVILPTSYSRYIEQEYGQSQSPLAKWSVNVIPDSDNEMNLIAYNDASEVYSFDITSTSDVASDYSISLLNVPSDISVVVDNNGVTLRANEDGKIIIDNLGGFDINEQGTTKSHTLEFISDENTESANVDIDLIVLIKQRISIGGE